MCIRYSPTSVDRVVTGTVAMLPFMSQKAVFILGCAEYSFPREVSEDKLFTDEELLILEEKHGIAIGMTSDRKVNYEKFLFTIASLAASEKCFFSYARKGLASSFESSYIGEIRRLFPLLSVEESPLPVSYTHLDVYKRQLPHQPQPYFSPSLAGFLRAQ